MKEEAKERYISLRSRGYSMRGAAGAVEVALSTAERWEQDARTQIADMRESHLAAVYQRYAIGRIDLLVRSAETLSMIDEHIERLEQDGTDVKELMRFIRLRLSTLSLLDRLHIPISTESDGERAKADLRALFVTMCNVMNLNAQNALDGDTEPLEG